jgi:hypothetical protein
MSLHKHPYPAHQIRGGASVSDDIIATFKEELRKMRQDLKREAEMELEATRKQLQKKLGKKVVARSGPIDLGVEEDDAALADDDEYEYIEEEIEVEVDLEEEEEEEERGGEEEDHDDHDGEYVNDKDLQSSHSTVVSEQEDDHEQSEGYTIAPTNTLEDYSRSDTASDSQQIHQDDEGSEENVENNDGGENEPNEDGTQPDMGERAYTEKVSLDVHHDRLHPIDNQDLLKSATKVNDKNNEIRTYVETSSDVETFEIGESEEIDGNIGMSNNEEQSDLHNIPKKNGTKSSKKNKSTDKDSQYNKKKRKKKNKKRPKKEKRKANKLKTGGSEQFSGSHIDTLAHDVAIKTLPQAESTLKTFMRAMAPTMITILLLILSHFMLEAIMKQFLPRK